MKPHVATPAHVALWDAINNYVKTCGFHPDERVYGNTERQVCVAAVERALDKMLCAVKCYCGQPIACNHEAHPDSVKPQALRHVGNRRSSGSGMRGAYCSACLHPWDDPPNYPPCESTRGEHAT